MDSEREDPETKDPETKDPETEHYCNSDQTSR